MILYSLLFYIYDTLFAVKLPNKLIKMSSDVKIAPYIAIAGPKTDNFFRKRQEKGDELLTRLK